MLFKKYIIIIILFHVRKNELILKENIC